jgi:hypothetical protein
VTVAQPSVQLAPQLSHVRGLTAPTSAKAGLGCFRCGGIHGATEERLLACHDLNTSIAHPTAAGRSDADIEYLSSSPNTGSGAIWVSARTTRRVAIRRMPDDGTPAERSLKERRPLAVWWRDL